MVQTHVLLWCEQHLHHDVGRCVTARSIALQEMRTLHPLAAESGTASVTYCMHDISLFLPSGSTQTVPLARYTLHRSLENNLQGTGKMLNF